MIKLAIDIMGGDKGYSENIKAIDLILKEKKDIILYLVGDEKYLTKYQQNPNVKIVHTNSYLDMGIKDVVGEYKKNKEASMFKALQLVKDNICDACISAGPTQALVLSSHLIIRKLPMIKRIALSLVYNDIKNQHKILLDIGANKEIKPEHLLDFSIMGSVLLQSLYNLKDPKVGIINIGTEQGKGRDQEVLAFDIFKEHYEENFVGYVEPTGLFNTNADVLVTDGFNGNIILKTLESSFKLISYHLKNAYKNSLKAKLGLLFLKKDLNNIKKTMKPNDIGGSLILGLNSIVVKVHGSGDYLDLKNAIIQAYNFKKQDLINKFKEELAKIEKEDENE